MKTVTRSTFFYPLLLVLVALTVTVITLAIPRHDSAGAVAPQAAERVDTARALEEYDRSLSGNTATATSVPPSPADREDAMVTAALFADPARASAPLVRSGQGSPPPGEVDAGRAPRQSVVADRGESFSTGQSASAAREWSDSGGAAELELVIPVPPGVKVPALFLDENPRPVPQQKMLDRMAAEFNEAVSNPPPGVSVEQAWEQARLQADQKYLKLFGYAAYNAYHLQAAMEAVREKRVLQAAPLPRQ
jgi:hypothetical protein